MTTYPATRIEASCPAELEDRPGREMTYEDFSFDNNLRARFAGVGLKAYAQRTGTATQEELATVITDLLGDLRHLCDATGVDFEEVSEAAERMYRDELEGTL